MDAFIGEIRPFAFNYAPAEGWLPCNGQAVPIQQYEALYAVIGYLYGPVTGNTFTLPNLQGKVLVGSGQLQGGSDYTVGDTVITGETVGLTPDNMPSHSHTVDVAISASGAFTGLVKMPENNANIGNFGTNTTPVKAGKGYAKVPTGQKTMAQTAVGAFGQYPPIGHYNMQPYLPLTYAICYEGTFPIKP